MDRGVPIKDIYPSTNYQNGTKVLVFIVDKFESMKAYNEWQALNGKEFECKNLKPRPKEEYALILNPRQAVFYMEHGMKLQICQPVLDYKTQTPVLAFYFDKEESKDVYRKWKRKHT